MRRTLFSLLSTALISSGCAYLPLQKTPQSQQRPQVPENLSAFYRQPYKVLEEKQISKTERERYSLTETSLKIAQNNLTNTFNFFSFIPNRTQGSEKTNASSLIIHFPVNGGNYFLEKRNAHVLANQGYVVMVPKRPNDSDDPNNPRKKDPNRKEKTREEKLAKEPKILEIDEILQRDVLSGRYAFDFAKK